MLNYKNGLKNGVRTLLLFVKIGVPQLPLFDSKLEKRSKKRSTLFDKNGVPQLSLFDVK